MCNFTKFFYVFLLSAVTALFLWAAEAGAANFLCGADLNGNGTTADKGELQQCWLTDEGTYLCPIQTAGCTATYVPVICPDGGTLNTVTDRCELAGGVNCDTGYSYDPANDICTATPDCSGGTLDTGADVCYQNIQCPQNFSYNSYYGACVKSPTCPSGGSYNGIHDRCEAPMTVACPSGYTYNKYLFPYACMGPKACPDEGYYGSTVVKTLAGDHICTMNVTMSCPAGLAFDIIYDINYNYQIYCTADKTACSIGSYNQATGKCESTATTTIPSGYVWDASMGAYLGDPSCPSGTTYNTATDTCEGPVSSYACPSGFSINASQTGCELKKCPGGTWVTDWGTYEVCEASPSINCPTGFNYASGYCTQDPTCDSFATYDAGSGKCVYNAPYSCSTGYTYNSTTGRCQEPPVCPTGTTYDPAIDRCAAPNPAAENCPLGNYPCDPGTGTCTKSYPCTTSFQTQAICMQNCDGACSSSCNTDAISAFGDVYWIGQTSTSWFGITGVTGSGSDLVFYGKDASYSDIEVGRVTMNGCIFSGSAQYFTPVADNCSSTSWGLSGLQATGNQITFYGGECGQDAGTITINGCYIQVNQSTGNFDITHVIGSGTSLAFYSGYSGNQPVTTIGLCQYSWQCSTCSKTDVCSYACPDSTYTLTADYRCVKFATCDGNGTLSTQLDVCEEVVAINCPTGYTAVGNQCRIDPTCPAGSAFNATISKCVTTTGITCPQRSSTLFSTQYAYNPAKYKCYADVSCPAGSSSGTPFTTDVCTAAFLSTTCPAGTTLDATIQKCTAPPTGYGTLDTNLDKYVYYATTSCPSGWTSSGGVCSGDPQCPSGSTWQADIGYSIWAGTLVSKCVATPIYTCPSGYTYGQYTDQYSYDRWNCIKQNSCQPGDTVQRSGDHYCISPTPPDKTCPVNYAYDSTLNGCFSSAICEAGALDTAINLCTVTGVDICPVGYALNATTSRCEASPGCIQPGAYSGTLDACTVQATYNCPMGYTYLNGTCYSLPNCPNGTYDSANKACFTGNDTCTIGNYPCYTYKGSRLCSPYSCVDQANPTVTNTTQSNLTNPTNDGTVNSNGTCSGQFYVLSGEAGECRTVGTQTLFHNCCNSATAMNPLYCDVTNEGAVAQKATQGMCHYVGTYCAETWALIGCVQSKKVYCCFNSLLARLINEQGRQQLTSFQPDLWGTPTDPKCRGFTPEEFQMLDFSQIDLSEYFSQIKTTLSTDVKNNATQKIQNFYQNVK